MRLLQRMPRNAPEDCERRGRPNVRVRVREAAIRMECSWRVVVTEWRGEMAVVVRRARGNHRFR